MPQGFPSRAGCPRLLRRVLQEPRRLSEVPKAWKEGNVMPSFKEGKDTGSGEPQARHSDPEIHKKLQ